MDMTLRQEWIECSSGYADQTPLLVDLSSVQLRSNQLVYTPLRITNDKKSISLELAPPRAHESYVRFSSYRRASSRGFVVIL